jgi:hypothetical protein
MPLLHHSIRYRPSKSCHPAILLQHSNVSIGLGYNPNKRHIEARQPVQDLLLILVIWGILLLPYLPLIGAVVNARQMTASSDGIAKYSPRLIWVGEGVAYLLVLVSYVYLTELAPHQGVITWQIFSHADPSLISIWNSSGYVFQILGSGVALWFFYKAIQMRKLGRPFFNIGISGLVCIVYSLMVPYLMSSIIAGIRDSHLL